jgi:hypothetical protein
MRNLTVSEMQAVSGGSIGEAGAAAATLALMGMCTTPLVIAVGGLALMYYVWC